MAFAEYGRYDALGLAELVRRGEISPAELLDEALARTEQLNPRLNAVIHVMEARARETLRTGLPDGPFRGVPFLLKDLLTAYAGEPMTFGSRSLRDHRPPADEELTRRYRSAGLVIFGKTNVPEFGLTPATEPELFGPTRNPWNLSLSPSGSSGGSAAAVAARIVPAASGNDGGGSIRTPASNCGLVGLKPSRGRNPAGPQAPDPWWGFVAEHVLTRTVRDCAAFLDATAGTYAGQLQSLPPPARPWLEETQRPAGSLRIGVCHGPGLGGPLHPDNRQALDRTVAALTQLGHQVEAATPPLDREQFIRAYSLLLTADLATTLDTIGARRGRAVRRGEVEQATWMLATMGRALRGADVVAAWWTLQQFSREWLTWADAWDVIVTPTVGLPPLPIGALRPAARDRLGMQVLTRLPHSLVRSFMNQLLAAFEPSFIASPYTMIANVTGQPSLSLPLHWTGDDLPMGVLFTARLGDEATLFRLAAQLEHAMPWAGRKAPHAAE